MKRLFLLFFLLPLFAAAQKITTHTVGAKESFSSIGRIYNINGRVLANYNNIEYEKGLLLGQVLKIPSKNELAKIAAAATAVKAKPVLIAAAPVKTAGSTNKSSTPIYHTVAKLETLYRISTLYNKVPIANIKKWNNLTSDTLSEGAKLIVGYSVEKIAGETKPVPVAKEITQTVKPKEGNTKGIKTAGEEEISVKAKQEKKEVPPPVKKTEKVITANGIKSIDGSGGYFKNIFDEQTSNKPLVSETGTGGVFKSSSGWEDGKYYCLHNAAAAGTIIKITNKVTGKWVFAKVLDMIPDIKQNTGLLIRLSNAAADAVGATADSKLDYTLSYSK
jgi:LysM repeat protein